VDDVDDVLVHGAEPWERLKKARLNWPDEDLPGILYALLRRSGRGICGLVCGDLRHYRIALDYLGRKRRRGWMKEDQHPKIGRPKGTGSLRVYETLRERILRLELAPGSDLDEAALVEEFGLSRTPVREALIRLAGDGLVRIVPNRGAQVSPLDISEVPDLLEALEICIRLTTRWAAVRRSDAELALIQRYCSDWEAAGMVDDIHGMDQANTQFHLAIARAAHNRHLETFYLSLAPGLQRVTYTLLSAVPLYAPADSSYVTRVNDQHKGMVAAIEKRDADMADEAAKLHTMITRERIVRYISSSLGTTTWLD
jgi:DNA-binding GntR family transcriptional regulator